MPLPPSVPRDEIHLRRIDLRGYRRDDGLYDIEARMADTKTSELTLAEGRVVPAGEALHDMSIRMVVDEDLNVIDIVASTDASPFGICTEATGTLQSMKGLRIAAGWSAAVRQRLAGRNGCTHLTELLAPLATVAFQTLSQVRNAGRRPSMRRASHARSTPAMPTRAIAKSSVAVGRSTTTATEGGRLEGIEVGNMRVEMCDPYGRRLTSNRSWRQSISIAIFRFWSHSPRPSRPPGTRRSRVTGGSSSPT